MRLFFSPFQRLLSCVLWFGITALAFISCSFSDDTEMISQLQQADSIPIYAADPTIFEDNGVYYLYGTDGGQPDHGFRVYQSTDLKNWEGPVGARDGFALVKDDVFGDKGFWAPQVWKEGNVFYMAYTANENIAIAQSTSPIGPFTQQQKVPIISEGKQIDPFIYTDDDGKKYLYHVKLQNGNRIFVAELNDDYGSIKPESLLELLDANLPWENTENASWPVAEGPTVIKRDNKYYMFYSANDFRNPYYAVGVAVADQATGPWTKVGNEALLSVDHTNWPGTGHGDVFRADNQWYYVCHTHNSTTTVGPRRTAIVPFDWNTEDAGGIRVPVFKGDKIKFLHVKN
ncbi:glycoside hydrolase family 43 protein [Sphingobacterium sp. lm-10]|uniref:glycoside hydrolase family 43 protein n=1 Tax=Sphingobacterium sp. lm-10 TaxID=2944904 RepID=UPI0020226A28|nr:glycoside hydrolase family 43 protein [Sphingobacterium sp. lm-10]MCL7987538.1 glycoside hydrolase family 43 protein [Sphingobacterium sp. lm-10]